MTKQYTHARILDFPGGQWLPGGRLDALQTRLDGQRSDLLMDYRELELTSQPALFEQDGLSRERLRGVYHPRRLCFTGAQLLEGGELVGADFPPLTLTSAFTWRAPQNRRLFLIGVREREYASLLFTARGCFALERGGPSEQVSLTRDWSATPAAPAQLVPNRVSLYRRFGGDPIRIRLHGRVRQRRLFIGGLDVQGQRRPDVDVVLNVGETASLWTAADPPHPGDRWDNKGEGLDGMDTAGIAGEARWVIERLEADRRVLVHCVGGMNRSATICCAVLILLEGLTAETALERVREQHPWARPDSGHWLALRWLAHTSGAAAPNPGA